MKKELKKAVVFLCMIALCVTSLYVPSKAGTNYTSALTIHTAKAGNPAIAFYALGSGLDAMTNSWEVALKAQDDDSGIYLNETKVPGAQMKKVAANDFYVEGFTAVSGDIVTIKGTFGTTSNGETVTIEESKFRFDGTDWTSVSSADYESALTSCQNASATAFYAYSTGLETMAASWDVALKAQDDDSGIYLNETKVPGAQMKKVATNDFYVEGFGSAVAGDIVTIKGLFGKTSKGEVVNIIESSFKYDGTGWSYYEKEKTYDEYTGTLTTVGASMVEDVKFVYLQGSDAYLSDSTDSWTGLPSEILKPDEDDANSGVFINGTKKPDGFMKKYHGAANKYIVDGIGTISSGDIVTVKGVFYSQDGKARITFGEGNFIWDGNVWSDYEEETFDEYTGTLTTVGAESVEDVRYVYLKGTDAYLADSTGAWTGLPSEILKPGEDDANSGVFINGRKIPDAFMKKYNGAENKYIVDGIGTILSGDIITVKGTFYSQDGKAKITYEESSFLWNGSVWSDKKEVVEGNNYKEKLSIKSGDSSHMYLLEQPAEAGGEVLPDINWEVALYPLDDESGIFINGFRMSTAYMKKVSTSDWYSGGWSVYSGDELVIKGKFGYSENNHTVTFEEVKCVWDGNSWVEVFDISDVPCEPITLKGIHNVSGFNSEQNVWKFYITLDGKIPGDIDLTQFQAVEVQIGNDTYRLTAAHSYEDTFYIGISGDVIPQKLTENIKITVKAGKYVTPDKKAGVDIKKDFNIYLNKYGMSSNGFLKPYEPKEKNVKLEVDHDTAYGGNQNGIYLKTEDKFPVDETWSTLIRAVEYDKNSGVFYNGKKTDAILKKYADGRVYVDLLGAGITAKNKDKVTIKGMFYLGEYAVSYKEYTLYFNGKQWNEKYVEPKEHYVKIKGKEIHPVTWFDEPTKQWKIYIKVDGKLPGSPDALVFQGLKIEINGKEIEVVSSHSHEGCLYLGIPEEYLSKDPKDGIEITVKKGKALGLNLVDGIYWAEDFSFYTYMGAVSHLKPTKNTKFQDIWIESTPGVQRFNKDAKIWQIFLKGNVELETEHTTPYLKLPVYLDGKLHEVTAAKENDHIYIFFTEDIIPGDTQEMTLTIKKGATAIANAGQNGIRFKKDFEMYLFNGVWSTQKFDETVVTKANVSGLQTVYHTQPADNNNLWDVYIWMDEIIPGTAWYENYLDFKYSYNGKEYEARLSKAFSSNNRLLHFPVYESQVGEAKEGDIITIEPQTITCGGYHVEFLNTHLLIYQDGCWSSYVKNNVKAPKDDKSLWEIAKFDSQYIPFTENGKVTFSSSDKYNSIVSDEDIMDTTVSFETMKLTDDNLSSVSIVLRGKEIDEETPMTPEVLYGYVVQFNVIHEVDAQGNPTYYSSVNIWKNGFKDNLTDVYRIAYSRINNEKFYEYNVSKEYEVSVYNVSDDTVCINVKVDGETVMRCYDTASDDPLDPAVNPGKFGVFAGATSIIYDDVYELGEVLATTTECKVDEAVWVTGSYPYVLNNTQFTVDKETGKVANGVFKATAPGEYTIGCTYDGKELKPIVITVTEDLEDDLTVGEEQGRTENWILIIILAGAVLLIGAGAVVAIILKGKKKRDNRA